MPLPLILAGMAVEELAVWCFGLLAASVVATKAVKDTATVLQHASESSSTPTTQTDTTTVVGKGKMNCGEGGNYGDMLKKTGDGKLDRDHVPSKAALQEAAKNLIDEYGIDLTKTQLSALFGDNGLISKQGRAIAIPKKDHQKHSETYGRRNSPEKIKEDAGDLQKAAKRDTKTIEEAEGKEMDDECAEKYKKEADEIRKKTNAEYERDLLKVIKEVKEKVK